MTGTGTYSSADVVIVDAGSTKTHAVLLDRAERRVKADISCQGINPLNIDDEALCEALAPLSELLDCGADVAYFGAGCLPGTQCNRVAEALRSAGAAGQVEVASDICAAALSVFGAHVCDSRLSSGGIVCILGTGSNTAYVGGSRKPVSQVASLGYILGDEGSGASLGRRLLRGVLRRTLPLSVCKAFFQETGRDESTVIAQVYRSESPNRLLAGFTRFLAAHTDDSDINNLIMDEFASFFEGQVSLYPNYDSVPLGFIGSVAKVFEVQLRQVAAGYGCEIHSIASSPMPGLIQHYLVTQCKDL